MVADNCTESERQFIFILVKKSKNKDQNKQNYLIFETKMYISIAVFWFYFHSKCDYHPLVYDMKYKLCYLETFGQRQHSEPEKWLRS